MDSRRPCPRLKHNFGHYESGHASKALMLALLTLSHQQKKPLSRTSRCPSSHRRDRHNKCRPAAQACRSSSCQNKAFLKGTGRKIQLCPWSVLGLSRIPGCTHAERTRPSLTALHPPGVGPSANDEGDERFCREMAHTAKELAGKQRSTSDDVAGVGPGVAGSSIPCAYVGPKKWLARCQQHMRRLLDGVHIAQASLASCTD
ncbi:hypothetical protein WJX84_011945 [Apatococcus fuscideae]|uniref:Uncharacterized protein n=1 Tax=Apatococcus fuscideae TaxID=2026836 RepID=A0AAW1SQV8_9CHLO